MSIEHVFHLADETDCKGCDAHIYVGDSYWFDDELQTIYCSLTCADHDYLERLEACFE